MTVEWVRIGDVLTRRLDAVSVDPEARYPMFGVRNFDRGAFDSGTLRGADTSYRVLYRAHAGDLVYLKLGAWELAFSLIPDTLNGHHASSEFVMYEPQEEKIDRRYLRHLIAWPTLIGAIGAKSTGTNVRRRRLKPETFEAAKVPLPDIPTQRRVAARLDAIADTTLATRAQQHRDLLAAVREQITLSAVSDAPRHPIHEVAELERETVDIEPSHRYRPIGVRSFGRGLIRYPDTNGENLSKLAYFRLPTDALVVSNIKAWEGAVAYSGTVPGHVTSSRFLAYVASSDDILVTYLLAYFRTSEGVAALAQASPGSADRNRTLGKRRFESIEVPVPSRDKQEDLLRRLALLDRVHEASARRAALQDALLPAARNEEFSRLINA